MVEALRSEYRKTDLYARHWPAQETKKETKETKTKRGA